MTIVTVSHWLENLVKQSFLSKYHVEVRHNTIDTESFKPTPSDFRNRYGIGNRYMILGVASTWTAHKGLQDFIRLSSELSQSEYAIVLIGLTPEQIKQIPVDIIALPRTNTPQELAEAYTAADVFVHPGVEETFGLVVAEAGACGTPVIVRKETACVEAAMEYASEARFIDWDHQSLLNEIKRSAQKDA